MNCSECGVSKAAHGKSPMGIRYAKLKPITDSWIAEDTAPMYPDEGIFDIRTCYYFKPPVGSQSWNGISF